MIKHFVEIVNTLNKVSLLPIIVKEDGKKIPRLSSWKQYQTQLPTEKEYKSWLAQGLFNGGVAVVCGKSPVSNKYLIVFDADTSAAVELLSKLTAKYQTRKEYTKKGMHVFFIVEDYPSEGIKLGKEHYSQDGKLKFDILGDGSYCVTHPTEGYRLMDEDVMVPLTISYDELAMLTQAIDDEIAKQNQQHEIIEKISPHYQCGNRHKICLALAGYLRKNRGFTKAEASKLIEALASMKGDEEIEDRLRCVEDTYARELDEIAGVSALRELGIELQGEAEAEDKDKAEASSLDGMRISSTIFKEKYKYKTRDYLMYDVVDKDVMHKKGDDRSLIEDDVDINDIQINVDYIGGLIPKKAISLLYGETGSGKTTFTLGILYNELLENQNSKVIYVDTDLATKQLGKLITKFKPFMKGRFFRITRKMGEKKVNLPEDLTDFIVVIDVITAVTKVSSNDDIKNYILAMQDIVLQGGTVILLGHKTKEDKDGNSTWKGASSLKNMTQLMCEVKRLNGGFLIEINRERYDIRKEGGAISYDTHVDENGDVKIVNSTYIDKNAKDKKNLELYGYYIKALELLLNQDNYVMLKTDFIKNLVGSHKKAYIVTQMLERNWLIEKQEKQTKIIAPVITKQDEYQVDEIPYDILKCHRNVFQNFYRSLTEEKYEKYSKIVTNEEAKTFFARTVDDKTDIVWCILGRKGNPDVKEHPIITEIRKYYNGSHDKIGFSKQLCIKGDGSIELIYRKLPKKPNIIELPFYF